MLYVSNGKINSRYLEFAAASFYYSTGYPVSWQEAGGGLKSLLPHLAIQEPFEGYMDVKLKYVGQDWDKNRSHLVYLDFQDLVILFPIEHKGVYMGSVVVGPAQLVSSNPSRSMDQAREEMREALDKDISEYLHKLIHVDQFSERPGESSDEAMHAEASMSELQQFAVKEYQNNLPKIKQFQLHHMSNLLNLVMNSSYYDPTIIQTLQLKNPPSLEVIPSAEKVSNRVIHHSMEQEEKVLQELLLSSNAFTSVAMRYAAKFSNLVVPPLADDPVRSEKNRFIVAATIVSRAAIKLGLTSDHAFSCSDRYINAVEGCTTVEEVWNLQLHMFSFFRNEVAAFRNKVFANQSTSILLSYIETHIETNQSLRSICAELQLDYKYASKCFKKDTGMGFTKYLTNAKIARAKRELLTTEASVQSIAERLGFNNAYYFTRAFKAGTGLSPTEYRKKMSGLYVVSAERK